MEQPYQGLYGTVPRPVLDLSTKYAHSRLAKSISVGQYFELLRTFLSHSNECPSCSSTPAFLLLQKRQVVQKEI